MSRKSFFLLVPLAAVFFWLAWAAVLVRAEERVSLVKDLNPIKGVDNLALTGAGDFFYFQNYDPVHGVELWECDGTLPGMRVVKDIRSGPGSSFPDNFTPADSLLYFTAEDGVHGRELWRTDGTESGTILLRDIVPGIASPKFTQFVAAGRMLYFLADDGTSGTQLWRSDGSPEGTSSLRSIKPKWWQSVDAIFPPVGSNVFFRTVVGQGQGEMWRTDGTTTGTARVLSQYITHPEWSAAAGGNLLFWVRDPADTSGYRWDLWLSDGTASGTGLLKSMGLSQTMVIQYPICTATIGPKAFFAVDDIYGGAELWRSDGTASGTLLVKQEIVPVSQMVSCGSRLFFTGSHDYYYEAELWVTDGTSSGTHQVLTRDSPESQIYLPSRLTPVGSSLFFFFDDGFHGCELWESDGTSTGTRVVKDISTGNSESVDPSDTRPTRMPVLGRTVFFSADDGVHSNALWCSDGTETGTAMLADVFNGSRSSTLSPYTVGGDSSVYVSSQETAPNPSTWRSDGTATGTVRLNGLLPSLASSEIRVMGSLGPVFLFFTHEWENTWTLWKSDGTTTGTESLKTCAGTNTQIYEGNVKILENRMIFLASDGIHGKELWTSDGTATGTRMVKDISVGIPSSSSRDLTVVASTLFFVADDGVHGAELWKTDGTEEGTSLVKDIIAGAIGSFTSYDSYQQHFQAMGSTLYFTVNDGVHGYQLWRSDGTETGTRMVRELAPQSWSPWVTMLTAMHSDVYLFLWTLEPGTTSREGSLWKTDGTELGTVRLQNIRPGFVREAVADSGLFLLVSNGPEEELWRSDGTEAGTLLLKRLPSIVGKTFYYAQPFRGPLMVSGSTVCAVVNTPQGMAELWSSDGTESGTRRLRVIGPYAYWQYASGNCWAAINGVVYFEAYDTTHGAELWKTDGTEAGTGIVEDIFLGEGSSLAAWSYSDLFLRGSTLFFSADDGIYGRELWKLDGSTGKVTRVGGGWSLYR